MNELLLVFALLLPVAWYFGYAKGKSSKSTQADHQHSGLSRKYFVGLNYLLNEEADKAIDTFVSMLEVDSETVETHLALGNLYRRRGEVDKAIRIHQNLIARPSLSASHRKMSLMELGYDYMAAGLLDRAENIFKELVNDQSHKQASFKQLLHIYQQTKDWQNAIKVSEKLQHSASPTLKIEIAHFYCELAENCMYSEAPREAVAYVKKALNVDPGCVRATLISGDLHYSMGRYKQAIKAYRELIRQDIGLLPKAIEKIHSSFIQLNDRKGLLAFLEMAIEQGAGVSTILAYAQEIQSSDGDRAAAEFIAMQMVKHPSIKGLLKLIDLHIKHASESGRPSLIMLQGVVSKLLKNKPVYHCNHCGFDSKTLFWQCPGCKTWGSVKPIQGIEGE
ncbi:lipopolysaccharide assembly protein LapB [Aliikangiella coralliicola]|uniref:Lipopolysaccharide assembly protein B n=1 Tax=Aliikangiella coralliicola TaxID=2592383 RepID=A0A545U4W8_9GAMM|nr:lipopolysaccharide assembly protein LapB [Aliikangiella coralliicola]TQV84502.1 lipopolysaccharide assembly protein LapB [Aliikangiella coralliicola]